MATKPPKAAQPAPAAAIPPDDAAKMPASNIWLAGLGALAGAQANAQAEGTKAFEALVKQGLDMQARAQAAAK